jgi:hypothetical protein
VPLADFTLGDAMLTVLEIFLFVVYFWILITIFGDLFHQMSGWGKAGWILVLFFVPFLGMLIYLIARGEGMRERAVKEQADMKRHMDEYVRETAGSGSTVDELAKLSELKDKGAISQEEFDRHKAKLLA